MKTEKKLIESKPMFPMLPVISLVIGIVWFVLMFTIDSSNPFGYTTTYSSGREEFTPYTWALIVGILLITVGILALAFMAGSKLHVTDKRVYGNIGIFKRVDIPIDSISSVAKIGWLMGVGVSSSSGTLRFMYLANAKEIHNILSKIIIERQNKITQNTSPSTTVVQQSDEADQIKKYKSLLDSGVITQEEFDAKKKQLLGL